MLPLPLIALVFLGGLPAEVRVAVTAAKLSAITIPVERPAELETLEKVLATVRTCLAAGRLTVDVDAAAFGADLPKLMAAPVRLAGSFGDPTADEVLIDALRQASPVVEADYAVGPAGVRITWPRLAIRTVSYDVRDVLRVPHALRTHSPPAVEPPPADGPTALVHLVLSRGQWYAWEGVELRNKARLIVAGNLGTHHDIAALLASLRRSSDLGVSMNARLYAVDRATYAADVAPLFAAAPGGPKPAVVRPPAAVLKKILRQTFVQESEDETLLPEREAVFLAREQPFRFAAGGGMRTGLGGVTVRVRPEVSPDRRYLRLRITQEIAELMNVGKVQVPDAGTGRAGAVEIPNVRKATVAGTIQILEGEPLLMPVSMAPPGKAGEGKVWVMVARPLIRIEAEERERGDGFSPRDIWALEVADPPKPAAIKRVPDRDDVKAILQAVLKDVLTNPDLKGTHEFYGTAADGTVVLSDGGEVGWPAGFRPETPGYRLVPAARDPFVRQRRVLGVRLDRFDLAKKPGGLFDTPIEVCVLNVGGSADGGVIGGCSVYYVPKRVGKGWTVELQGIHDP